MLNPMSLEGKNIIVTGASSGIGKETAILLSKLGAKLLLLDLDEEGLKYTQTQLKNNSVFRRCDVMDFEYLKNIIVSVVTESGEHFHGLVHCAGIPSLVPLRALSNVKYEKVQRINTQAGMNLAKIFSSRNIHDTASVCSIVYISSVYGIVGSAANVAYATSKAALIGMTKSLALELAPKIRINCIAPGFVKTNMADGVNTMFDEKYADRIEEMHPLGWGEPRDIANGIAFLLSDVSKWTTGAVFNIDGGFTAQ